MNAKDYERINKIVGRIQNNKDNVYRAYYMAKVENNEIVEPFLYISMADYRTLCEMSSVYDTLSKKLVNGQLVPKEG